MNIQNSNCQIGWSRIETDVITGIRKIRDYSVIKPTDEQTARIHSLILDNIVIDAVLEPLNAFCQLALNDNLTWQERWTDERSTQQPKDM